MTSLHVSIPNISPSFPRRRIKLRIHHEHRESNPEIELNIENPRSDWLKYLYIRLDITRKIMLDGVLLCPDSQARSLTVALLLEIRVELLSFSITRAHSKISKGYSAFLIGMIHRGESSKKQPRHYQIFIIIDLALYPPSTSIVATWNTSRRYFRLIIISSIFVIALELDSRFARYGVCVLFAY